MRWFNIKISGMRQLSDAVEAALDAKARTNKFIETDAAGQSMSPTIVTGDRIVMNRTKISTLQVGDIIAFGKGSFFICHRIKEIREREGKKYFLTIGDAYEKADDFEVEAHEIAGKVIKVIKPSARQRIASDFRRGLKAALKRLGVGRLSKKSYLETVRGKLKFQFSIPRDKKTHPSLRFIDVPMEGVAGRPRKFFAPLHSLGGFRVLAALGKFRIASVEVEKFECVKHPKGHWAVSGLWVTDVFRGTGLEEEMITSCRALLENIGVKDLTLNKDKLLSRIVPG